MKYFVRLMVFVFCIFVAGGVGAFMGAEVTGSSSNKPKHALMGFVFGGIVGLGVSGLAMDSVAGKLPPDEQ